jgi:hypothetical protein
VFSILGRGTIVDFFDEIPVLQQIVDEADTETASVTGDLIALQCVSAEQIGESAG